MARETGSSRASRIPTTAETWLGANRSISSWACCLSAAITRLFYTASSGHSLYCRVPRLWPPLREVGSRIRAPLSS